MFHSPIFTKRDLYLLAHVCCFVVMGCIFSSGTALAQSALDKLEQKLKEQNEEIPLVEPVEPVPSDELPVPNNKANSKGPPLAPEGQAEGTFIGLEVAPLGPDEIGVLVTEVIETSPAWKAGIMVGDRLLGFNGEAIEDINDFGRKLSLVKPGSTVRFIVDRNGRNLAVPIIVQRLDMAQRLGIADPSLVPDNGSPTTPANTEDRAWLGCSVADLSETWRRQFSIPVYRGAAISEVVENSPADTLGLKPGDVIIEIGGRAIEGAADLTQWLSEVRPGTPAKISFFRGLTARVGEVVVGSLVETPATPGASNISVNRALSNLKELPIPEQIQLLRAEMLDMQQRMLEIQRELDRLQRAVNEPK